MFYPCFTKPYLVLSWHSWIHPLQDPRGRQIPAYRLTWGLCLRRVNHRLVRWLMGCLIVAFCQQDPRPVFSPNAPPATTCVECIIVKIPEFTYSSIVSRSLKTPHLNKPVTEWLTHKRNQANRKLVKMKMTLWLECRNWSSLSWNKHVVDQVSSLVTGNIF